jgi:uracil permease
MFGATVLVPLITGLNPSVALFTAGVGTLIFHLCTKGIVPVFLGSSFAFLGAISLYSVNAAGESVLVVENLSKVQGGIIVAGAIYLLFALLVYLIGVEKIKKIFPPIVTGPVIVLIGVGLAGTALNDCLNNIPFTGVVTRAHAISLLIALFTLIVVIILMNLKKGFAKLIPILIGIASGYVLCVILNQFGVFTMDFSAVSNAQWINVPFVTKDLNGVPFFSLPTFDVAFILSIAPIAIVTFMEHIGDITTNSAVVGKDFLKDPGLHRTLIGDGVATMFAGFLGGPANTTYSENTGVLATTKNYNPKIIRVTAILAIILGLFGKFGAVLQTIPGPVKGGVEVMLFGMIAAIGIRTISEAQIDFTENRNLIIVALILVSGLGINALGGLTLQLGAVSFTLSGLFVAVVLGVLANVLIPKSKREGVS